MSNSLKITRFYGDKERKDKQAELKQAELNAQKDYKASLSDLKGNSKPLINTLSIVAGENRKFGKAITETIENHLIKASGTHKLPCLYLVDSIIKNVGAPYIEHISKCVVRMFTNTFTEGDETVRKALFKLRLTWKDIFTVNKLKDLDASVHEIDTNWPKIHESEASSTTVHINPNFLTRPAPSAAAVPSAEADEIARIRKEKAALEKAQRKFEEEKKQFERRQLQLQLKKQKERLLNENKATASDSESSVLGEIVKGTPASQQAKSPSKPKDKRKLDKAPKHPEMQPPAVKPTKRTARKSIANAPATVPQKITRVGRIPKISAEEKAKAVEQANEKKRLRQSDSEGSETEKQKPKRVYPLRSRSTSGDPRENNKDDSGSDMSVDSDGDPHTSRSRPAGPRPGEPKPPIPVATVNPAPMNIPVRPPPPNHYMMPGKPSHENTAQPPSPEKQFVRPPPPTLIPPRPPAPLPAPPRPIPPPQVQDIPLRPPAPNIRPPVPAPTGPVRLEKDPGKGKIKIIAPLKLPGDPEESAPVANKPPPGPAPAAMRPSFEDRQTSDPRYNEKRGSRSPDPRFTERRDSPGPDPRDRPPFRSSASPDRHYRETPAQRDDLRRDEARRENFPPRDAFPGQRGDFSGPRDDRRPDMRRDGPVRDDIRRDGPGPLRDDMRRDGLGPMRDGPGPIRGDGPGPIRDDLRRDGPGPMRGDGPGPIRGDGPGPIREDIRRDGPGPIRDDIRRDGPMRDDMRRDGPMRDDMRRDDDWRRDDRREFVPRDVLDRRRDVPPRDDIERRREGGRGGRGGRRGSPHMRRGGTPPIPANPERKYYGVLMDDVAAVPQGDLPEIVMFGDGPKKPPQDNFTIDRKPDNRRMPDDQGYDDRGDRSERGDRGDRGRGYPRGRGAHGPPGQRDMDHERPERGGFRGRGGRGARGRDNFPSKPENLPHRYLVKADYAPSQFTRLFHVAAGDFEKGNIEDGEFQALKEDIRYYFPNFRFPGRHRGSFRGGPRGGSRDRSFDGSYGPREPGPPGVSGPSPAPTLPGPAGPTAPQPRQRQPAPRLQVPDKPPAPVKQLDPASLFDKLLKTGLVVQNAPFKLSFDYIMNLNKDALINSMYTGTPCTNCGKRFDEEEVKSFNVHLDWHFRMNTMSKSGQIAKKWYLTADDWTSATSNSGSLAVHNADNNDNNPGDSWQRADADPLDDDFCGLKRCQLKADDEDFCHVCHDRLQQEFNQKEDEWYFINAQRRTEDGKVCHSHCTQEGIDEGNVTQGLEVTMNESIVDSIDSGSRSRIDSQISQDLVTPTTFKPPDLVVDKEKEATMLALLEKAKTALTGNKSKISSPPPPPPPPASVPAVPEEQLSSEPVPVKEEPMEVNEEAAPDITPNTEELPPVDIKEVKKEEEDECLDDDIFEETSASAAAPMELDIKKEVDEAILALK
ncbi:pre-mRNA cleavage complex 2 protein Pcf11-like [Bolinopsis microptera]|uniref:pre-mRNA cleavage complex 2 protein Pcf11-like n=1 Tax=Bolinopsis microptera TaxID=2820187 RepID=UPI00307A714B